jgi:hypothetical protein
MLKGSQLTPYAQGANGYTAAGDEPYLAVSPGVKNPGCEFGTDQAFALHKQAPFAVVHIYTDQHLGPLAAIPGVDDLNGLAFDTIGKFGMRLLAVSNGNPNSTVWAIDCYGRVAKVTDTAPRIEGGMQVAPSSFGAFAGNLIGANELDGKIYAIDQTGHAGEVVDSHGPTGGDIGVESLGFVPAGFIGSNGAAYVANLLAPGNPHPGTNNVMRISAGDLRDAGVQDGDMLVATEAGGRTYAVRCSPDCSIREIGHASDPDHIEGHIVFIAG